MIINYSKQAIKFLSKQDKPTRIRIVEAINQLPQGDVKKNLILKTFGTNWENVKEVTPDDWDLQMLQEIKSNPECHEFVSEDDAMKELGLI